MSADVPDALCQATGCPGVVYERPGYGASDPRPLLWPDDVLEQEAEIVLPALLELWGSSGAHRSFRRRHDRAAAALPERVRAVITLAAHVVLEELTSAGVSALERSWHDGDLRSELERLHGPDAETLFRAWSIIDRLPLMRARTELKRLQAEISADPGLVS